MTESPVTRSTATLAALSCGLVVLLLSTPVLAQTFGNVHGSIVDENGTSLPGTTVTISGVGAPQIQIAGEHGEYRFLNLDPGTYHLEAKLDGYSTVEQPNVIVALNRNSTIDFTLSNTVTDTITVTAETPLLDERKLTQGTLIDQRSLEGVPTARDPWALMNQAPGVLVGTINVGGSESGQQSGFAAPATDFRDNDWLMDGVQITDVYGGSPTTYFDFDQFEAVELSTGGTDVTKNTGGVAVNLVTKRGTNEFRGSARFLSTKGDGLGFLGQSSSSFDCSDLGETQDCDTFETDKVNNITEYGFEAGGPAITDRLWLWGSYGDTKINRQAAGGDPFLTNLENVSVKLNAQLGSSNSFLASWNNGNKTAAGRGSGPTRAPETTANQRGPSAYWRFEDTHVFSSNLFLTGSYQKIDGGFQLQPRSGCLDESCPLEQETLWDSDGVWKQNFGNRYAQRPEDAFKLDGSYFFTTGDMSHELKFGGRYREAGGFTTLNWPGRSIIHVAGENFGVPSGPIDFFILHRAPKEAPIEAEYTSLWLQDTLAAGNWTINLGLRYDLQQGTNQPGTTGISAVPNVFPTVTLEQPLDAGFDWETILPRIGATYAVGDDRDTLLRASFSQFPAPLTLEDVAILNPMAPDSIGAYAYFLFIDIDGNNQFDGNEPYSFQFGLGYDIENPTTNWNTVDPDYDPQITSEAILGVEHSFLPEFVVGLNVTWRDVDDIRESRDYVRPAGTSGAGRPWSADDFVLDGTTTGELPDGSEETKSVYSLDGSLENMGFRHQYAGSRSRDYSGVSLTVNKRLANQWSLRGFINWGESEWNVPAAYDAVSDPTDLFNTSDNDGGLQINGGGRNEVWMQSSWQWNLNGIYQLAPEAPWGFNLSANLYGREGYALPYNSQVVGRDGVPRQVSLVGGDVGRFRNDDVLSVDLRAEKTFGLSGDVNLTFGMDLFNALNEAPTTARESTLNRRNGDWVLSVMAPRIWRLGVRVSWK